MSDDRIKQLEERVAALEGIISAFRRAVSGEEEIDDADLDSERGNPAIRKDPTPRYWSGPSFVGSHLSECTPEYLDAFAKYKLACAAMSERDGGPQKKKYAAYDRLDAARARGWAKRLRAGWTAPEKPKTNGSTNRFASNGVDDSRSIGGMNGTGKNPFRSEIDDEREAIQEEAQDEMEQPL